MRTRVMAAAGTLCLALTACYDQDEANYSDNGYNAADAAENGAYNAGGGTGAGDGTAASNWPTGSRILVEEGVTYRIEPGGIRVRLGENDSRILVENGVRYRVDPGGVRVRIDDDGAVVVGDGVTATIPVGDGTVTVNTP